MNTLRPTPTPAKGAGRRSGVARITAREELTEGLTRRELDVLTRIARGQSNREIATGLHVSEETVKTHVSNVLAKLQVEGRTQAAIYALRRNLVQPDDPAGDEV